MNRRNLVILLAAASLAGALGLKQALAGKATPSSLCPAAVPLAAPSAPAPSVSAEGRVVAYPGADVVVGADFAGRLARVAVDEKARVRKGDLLAEVDASEEKAQLVEARSRIAEAEADLRLAEAETVRARQLLEGKVGSRQALDRAERDREAAVARRATASADAERLAALVAKSRILSPIDGVVVRRWVSAGETVARGDRTFRVADLKRLRIEAEVDESESGRIRVGAPVEIRAEEEPGLALAGRVEEVPDSVEPRKSKPSDPARPVDTRVLLVKVAVDGGTPLRLGRRVELSIR